MYKNLLSFYRIPSILFLSFLLLSISACKKKSAIDYKNLGWSGAHYEKYIAEYSSTQIGIKDNITIRLVNIPDKIKSVPGSEISSSIASISPSAKGKFLWTDQSTLTFIPDDKLESNTSYAVKLNLGELYNSTDKDDKSLTFTLATINLKLSLTEEGISYDDQDGNAGNITLNGSIHATDFIESGSVEKMLQVAQKSNKDLKIEWTHINDKEHAFTVKGIKRFDTDENLDLVFNGKEIDADFVGKRTIAVVAKNVFAHVETKVNNEDAKTVDIIFSDPLENPQNLDGLITIDGKIVATNYTIESNRLKLYFDNSPLENFTLGLSNSIKNKAGKSLSINISEAISFKPSLPEVIMLRKGIIMPETDRIILPFQAKNLNYVNVSVTKIYQNNVLQFLQNNDFTETYNLTPVGKEVINQKVDLKAIFPESNYAKFQNYSLDLSKLVTMDKGAIYYVVISFTNDFVDKFPCKNNSDENNSAGEEYDGEDEYGGYTENDPCQQYYYYGQHFAKTLLLASNIGIVAKASNDNTMHIVCSDLKNAQALSGVELEIYDFQKQLLGKTTSDAAGMAKILNKEKPAFIIAKHNGEFGYINTQDNYANVTSEFDVSGKVLETGLDAFIYSERGVYRPGDSMHVNVMVFNHNKMNESIPSSNFPVRLTIEDPRGKIQYDKVVSGIQSQIYYFPIQTKSNASTGTWKLSAHLGNEKFYKNVKVETVKPNKLKIYYSNEKTNLKLFENPNLTFESKWLHGASAEGLKSEVDLTLSPREVSFLNYKAYTFEDPARNIDYVTKRVYDGNLNNDGRANYNIKDDENLLPSSGINAVLKTRVYEKSGAYSEDYVSFEADKYSSYVGIKLPESDWGGHYFKSSESQSFPIVSVNNLGKPLGNRKLSIGLYHTQWDWWYSESNFAIMKFNSGLHVGAIKTYDLTTNAKGEAKFNEKFEDEGNYMIRICDTESGHCTGDFFYASRWGNPPSNNGAAQLLTVTTDKETYNVGDEIKLRIPSNANSKILISVEKGSEVNQIFKIDGKQKETEISIPITKEMSPNVYLNVSLIQPYSQNTSGLPLRMYGIANVKINDPTKTLVPVITATKIIAPNEKFTVDISESKGKDMSYTLAIVDEGLLDLTRFKTPDPINHFFAKQSLGVNTWDIYDKVMNPYGREIENAFSVGGDGDGTNINSVKKANRFIPTVKYLGPFKLKAGGKNSHKLSIDNYVGSVRIMVVAKNETAFGNAEKTCPVKKDLMVQNTLPRVLTPGDEINLAANVFAMNNSIKNVNLGLSHDNFFTSNGPINTTLSFTKEGDQLYSFPLTVKDITGIGKIGSQVSSGNLKSKEDIEIEIRNPNPSRTESKDLMIEAGKSMDVPFTLFGSKGTNAAEVEVSNAPLINMGKRLDYLIQYPHGCIEQTTSAAFPQLYLADISELSVLKKQKVASNISKAIQKLASFQVSNGGFSYWPGANNAEDWATSYAGHFLIEAKEKANYVPESMLKRWVEYQKGKANAFNGTYDYGFHAQAYRLYTLAKYGKPELGAMNRLRSQQKLDAASINTLAAAYAIIGKKDIATTLLNSNKNGLNYTYNRDYDYYTYGSDLRNKAMYAETYYALGNEAGALTALKSIAADLNSSRWYNTQGIAYALMVLQKFYSKSEKAGLNGDITFNGKKIPFTSTKKILLQELSLDQNNTKQNVRISNTTKGKMYVRMNYTGKDEVSKSISPIVNKHVNLNIRFTDAQGKQIDIKNAKQGSTIIAKIDITNNGSFYGRIDNLALNFIVPAGWEINNERLAGIDKKTNGITYQDIKDDRVLSYFNLHKNISVQIPLTATYAGKFYFPPVSCEAMYNNEIFSMTGSQYVTVSPSSDIQGKGQAQ